MKKLITWMMLIMTAIGCVVFTAAAETAGETPAYRTDVSAEEYLGTWKLKSMLVEGYMVPTESLGLNATIIVTEGQIEINDTFGKTKVYETTYEDGKLFFINEHDEKLFVYITEDGMLHVDQEIAALLETEKDENAPVSKSGGAIHISNLSNSVMTQYFERVTE